MKYNSNFTFDFKKNEMNIRFFSVLLLMPLWLTSCGSLLKKNHDLATIQPIETAINLTEVINDKAPVTINPGRFKEKTVIYRLPRVVQGTYSVSDFGKYIDDFKAFDYNGNLMPFVKTDTNSWTITNAQKLDKITYYVNDTFDIEEQGGIGKEHPFSPSGTNIEPNNYVLNLHGFIGYFDSLKDNQYRLELTAPSEFVRTAALQHISSKTSDDGKRVTTSYLAPRYFDITDNPIMYGDLDVEEFQVADIKIVLSVYSPNKVHSAKSLKEVVYKMMQAQKNYLGTINATPRYDIYLYLSEEKETSPKGFGALEHHTSTVVVLPESMDEAALSESMIDVVSHEFFHIVTPLNVHSEDVHYFDYNKPTFSKHLWMYEGVTEYFATLFQVHQNLVSEPDFFNKIMGKIEGSRRLNDAMSFTIMSENVLKAPYKDQYLNVYQKGALIGMCIDILIREESQGRRGILSLMKALSTTYGKNKPFEDDMLIDEITAMTYPSVGAFLKNHVVGDTPIDYNYFFNKMGLEIGEGQVETNYIIMNGMPIVSGDPKEGVIFFTEAVLANSFWADNGVQPKDVIKKINGEDLTFQNANQLLQKVYKWQQGKAVEVVLERNGEERFIQTTTTKTYTIGNRIKTQPEVSETKKALCKAWLKG